MRINTNISAQNTLRNLNRTEAALADSTAKLSSGFRINKASDDAAGLAIANKLRNTGVALTQASRNNDQASAMLQIADGGAEQIAQILDRMKELATQAASGNVGSDADKLDAEYSQLKDEITRIVNTTVYQGTTLLDGSNGGGVVVDSTSSALGQGADVAKITLTGSAAAGKDYTISSDKDANGVVQLLDGATVVDTALATDGAQTLTFQHAGVTIQTAASFHIGDGTNGSSFDTLHVKTTAGTGSSLSFIIDATGNPTDTTKDQLAVSLNGIDATSALTKGLTLQSDAQTAMGEVDTLLDTVNSVLGQIGAAESRLSYASQALASKIQNYSAAESTIRDVDMAAEMSNFQKNSILAQAGTAMLAQANASAQNVLKLFQ